MTFPLSRYARDLVESDLLLFSLEFGDIVSLLFSCRQVNFAGLQSTGDINPDWKAGIEMVRNNLEPVVESGEWDHLFLPLWSGESLLGVAIVNAEKGAYQNETSAGLLEKSRQVSRHMRMVKQHLLDPATGLPGGAFLERRLRERCGDRPEEGCLDPFSLSLLELYPRARDASQALSVIAGSASFLESLIGHLCTLCHLGNGVFAFVLEKTGEEQAMKLAEMILRWLKREGFARSRIGISVCDGGKKGDADELLLQQAWEALGVARKRGPFALCSFQGISARSSHPLCPPSVRIFSELKKLWQDEEQFTLALLHLDQMTDELVFPWEEYVDRPLVRIGNHEAFVFLGNHDRKASETWCLDFQKRAQDRNFSFSIGAAVYPHENFKKGDLPANCRKALVHTGFLGPGSLTFFSGVSLNISGDIYYNEGDLARAVREYRLGLQLDPHNINLLNSLGVSFAQMNLYKRAIPLFQEVLGHDPVNFMALFNLGFAYLSCNQEGPALESFEKALDLDDANFDLLLQLGKLYCKTGRYAEAVKVLGKGEEVGPVGVRDISHGAVYRYLGEARKGLGENVPAIVSLQRAVRHNSRDAAALSMLGELYCREKQGGEIAASLCRQAVELDGADWRHWERLGFVLIDLERYDEALRVLRKGLAISGRNPDLLCRLAHVYEKTGKIGLAEKMYKKVLRLDPQHRRAADFVAFLEDSGMVAI
ncbi:MAG: tetratricopeptide repeat protein [Pseudomonadota bacterium]